MGTIKHRKMNSKILKKLNKDFPLKWVNLDFLPDSSGKKVEIYLSQKDHLSQELILMFYLLFNYVKDNIEIYNPSWWDFCMDTWNYAEDKYDYSLDSKTEESRKYLIMLRESDIEIGYSGICNCNDWDKFLSIILDCIMTHQAPYSPIFYDEKNDFFFYFHHSGSMGFYYYSENEIISKILNTIEEGDVSNWVIN